MRDLARWVLPVSQLVAISLLVHSGANAHTTPTSARKGLSSQAEDGHVAVSQDYIVKFTGNNTNHIESLLKTLSEYSENSNKPDFEAKIKRRFTHLFDGAVLNLSPEAFEWLNEDYAIDKLEVDAKVSAFPYFAEALTDRASSMTKKSKQNSRSLNSDIPWNLDRIDQRSDVLDGKYSFNSTGKNVNVYVIDTGILVSHEEFDHDRAVLLANTIDNIDTDCNGHGTHVAGTIGGKTVGVAKDVKLLDLKALDCDGSGTTGSILFAYGCTAMEIAAQHHVNAKSKVSIMNLSLGGGISMILDESVSILDELGIVVIAAAGNSNEDACLSSPARAPVTITVGSTRKTNDQRSSFSNFGPCVNIFAPGQNILSAFNGDDNDFKELSGTSMAAPLVSGIAAQLVEKNPDSTPGEIASSLVCEATTGMVDDLPDEDATVNLLSYADPEGVVFVGMNDDCKAGKDNICSGSPTCNGHGECLQYGQCSCDCDWLGENCAFGPEIHDLGKIDEGMKALIITGSTKDQPPVSTGFFGAVHYTVEIISGGLEVTTCTEDTTSSTYLLLTSGCVNNKMFHDPWDVIAHSGTDNKCTGSAARLSIADVDPGHYRLIVMGNGNEGNFGLSYGPSGSIGERVIDNYSPRSLGPGHLLQMLLLLRIACSCFGIFL